MKKIVLCVYGFNRFMTHVRFVRMNRTYIICVGSRMCLISILILYQDHLILTTVCNSIR